MAMTARFQIGLMLLLLRCSPATWTPPNRAAPSRPLPSLPALPRHAQPKARPTGHPVRQVPTERQHATRRAATLSRQVRAVPMWREGPATGGRDGGLAVGDGDGRAKKSNL